MGPRRFRHRQQFAEAFAWSTVDCGQPVPSATAFWAGIALDKLEIAALAVSAATLRDFFLRHCSHGRNAFLIVSQKAVPQPFHGCPCALPMKPYKMVRLLRPTLGMLASSTALAVWRSSILRKPAFANARAAPSGRPLRSHSFEASQYSSNVEGLRLMSDNSPPNPAR
jgi:hypothetical protein